MTKSILIAELIGRVNSAWGWLELNKEAARFEHVTHESYIGKMTELAELLEEIGIYSQFEALDTDRVWSCGAVRYFSRALGWMVDFVQKLDFNEIKNGTRLSVARTFGDSVLNIRATFQDGHLVFSLDLENVNPRHCLGLDSAKIEL